MTRSSEYNDSKLSNRQNESKTQPNSQNFNKFNLPSGNINSSKRPAKKNDIMNCLNGIMPQIRMTTGNSNASDSALNGLSPINEVNKRYTVDNTKITV